MTAKLTKKNKITIIIAIALLLAIIGVFILMFLQINTNFDSSLVTPLDTSVTLVKDRDFTTLMKTDKSGYPVDEPFKIVAFTDLHLDTYIKKGRYTMELLIENIKVEQPDLVVLVGDNITSSYNRGRVKQLCEVMEGLNVYWAPVFGNHEGDNWQSVSRQKMGDTFASYPHCLFEPDTKQLNDGSSVWGIGNYAINIVDGQGVRQTLYFLDSGAFASRESRKQLGLKKKSYDHLKPSQIEWYRQTVEKISTTAGEVVPSMLYVHIPIAEFALALDDVPKKDNGNILFDEPSSKGTLAEFGVAYEEVCCPRLASGAPYSCGLFDTIKECGSTQAVVSGHDHINNFRIKYQDVYLIYNQVSGYSSYNVKTKGLSNKLLQGCSIYLINENGTLSFKTVSNADRFPELQEEILRLYK